MDIKKLEFAKSIGATHIVSGWMMVKMGDNGWQFYNELHKEWISSDMKVWRHERIDFSPLEQHGKQ